MKTQVGRIDWADVKRRLADSQTAVEERSAEANQQTQEILRRRASELAARRQSADPVVKSDRLLVCTLGSERYGVELQSVHEVLPFANCTPIPGAPPQLLGVINLRGKIRSVLCLSRLLQLPETDRADRAAGHLAIINSGGLEVALRVERVEQISAGSLDSLQPLGEASPSQSRPYLRGVTANGVIILNLPAILANLSLTQKVQ